MMYGAPPPAFDDIEEALGRHGDSADEDDVPAANTPSDEAAGDEDDEQPSWEDFSFFFFFLVSDAKGGEVNKEGDDFIFIHVGEMFH